MRYGIILAAMLCIGARLAVAAPLDLALQQELLALYDRYNKAIAAGKLQDALALRTDEVRVRAKKELKTAKQQRDMLEMAKGMVPESLQVLHATINRAGDKAEIMTVASATVPKGRQIPGGPAPGTVLRSGLTLDFVKQGGGWRFDNQTFGPDPSKLTACKDTRNEPAAAYDTGKDVSVGGPIVRVEFQPDYTMIVLRVLDEENCAFLPSREVLARHGLPPEQLVPYAIVEIDGSPHRTDKQKVLVDKINVRPED